MFTLTNTAGRISAAPPQRPHLQWNLAAVAEKDAQTSEKDAQTSLKTVD
jgi:hypothetical protein